MIVLSDGLWRAKFGGNRDILGRTVVLDDVSHVIVGVMPQGFEFPTRDVAFWAPLRFPEGALSDRTDTYLDVVARLRDGVSLDDARSEMRVIAAQLERAYPKENAQTSATVHFLRDQVSQQARTLLMTLVGAAICMLLIACTNLANLLLSRGLARQKRARGPGGDRRRAATADPPDAHRKPRARRVRGRARRGTRRSPRRPWSRGWCRTRCRSPRRPAVDLRMLAVAAVVTVVTGIAFGVLPALRATRAVDPAALREGGRAGAGRSTERVRSILVIAAVTASVVLLVASGLLVRALWRVQQIDPGFRADNVLTLRTALPRPEVRECRAPAAVLRPRAR